VVVWAGECPIPIERVAGVLNARLPDSIRLSAAESVADDWDPVRSLNYKRYSYRIWRGSDWSLPWLRYCHRWSGDLNWEILQTGARRFLGEHDFRAFRGEGSTAKTTVRTVRRSYWAEEADGRIWRYEVEANGFLYHMVRMMVGAMLQDAIDGQECRVRCGLDYPAGEKVSGPVPAKGLTLEWVEYQRDG
jgi:tRNA pseudouridine38-40 synthase